MKEKIKLAVVGSRAIEDYEFVEKEIDKIAEKYDIAMIVSGGAYGVDTLAMRYARENLIPTKVFEAYWSTFGKSAGYKRNVEIVEYSDLVLACYDGKSRGTQHSINIAKEKNKKLIVSSYIVD